MTINENILQLTGKANIPEPLEVGQNYKIEISGSIITETLSDNHDGTFNKLFKYKPIIVGILKPTGETIKSKDTRSISQLVRGSIWKKWVNAGSDISFDDYYEKIGYGLIRDIDEFLDRYI